MKQEKKCTQQCIQKATWCKKGGNKRVFVVTKRNTGRINKKSPNLVTRTRYGKGQKGKGIEIILPMYVFFILLIFELCKHVISAKT